MSIVKFANKLPVDVQHIFRDDSKQTIITAIGQTTIQRTSDKKYWNETLLLGVGDWQDAQHQNVMTKVGDTNSPGMWEYILVTATFSPDSYIFIITDSASKAANVPATFTGIVGDMLALFQEWAAAGAIGKAVYNAGTSVLTLTFVNGTDTLLFDMKDAVGNPAESAAFFQKVPQ
jgi:hypothetical protein